MLKSNRISNRLNTKLNNVFKKVINERRLLTEAAPCNNDWDCGDGKWCGPHPPCDAAACAYGSKGECACIKTDCSGPEMVADFEDIEVEDLEVVDTTPRDEEVINIREAARLLKEYKRCSKHNDNEDGYNPGCKLYGIIKGKCISDSGSQGVCCYETPGSSCDGRILGSPDDTPIDAEFGMEKYKRR